MEMIKHKKNCSRNLEEIQHRYIDGDNGQKRKLYRIHCPNCKNNKILNEEELGQWVQTHPLGINAFT